MCGRYLLTAPLDAVRAAFAVDRGVEALGNFPPRYNIAPTQTVPIIRLEEGERIVVGARWGLVPSWAKDLKGKPLINARSETARTSPAFRASFARRRCLAPADGFYEWKAEPEGPKTPYWMRPREDGPVAFAALWARWRDEDGGVLDSMAILTTRPNAETAPIHDRMPCLLAPQDWAAWLDPDTDHEAAERLLGPAPDGTFEPVAVSRAVNSVRNDGPELITPAPQEPRLL